MAAQAEQQRLHLVVHGRTQAAQVALVVALAQEGGEMVLICTNLMHKVAPAVEQRISVPLVHIADAAGSAIRRRGLRRVGLLGTRYTMEEDFYRQRLQDKFGLEVIIPEANERDLVHRVIFDELCRGRFTDSARRSYLAIIDNLRGKGAEGVILGCTEIPLLVRQQDTDLPLFNTTSLHAQSALELAFS